MAGRKRIGPRRPPRLFLAEWREKRDLSQKELGWRLDPPVSDVTVSRWEKAARGERGPGTSQMNDDVKAALAEALQIEPIDLYRHPDRPTADELVRLLEEATPDQRTQIRGYIEGVIGKRAAG